MRLGNLSGRAALIQGQHAVDIATASQGTFGPSVRDVLDQWEQFSHWARNADFSEAVTFDDAELESPVQDPRQIFAIGLNYRDHAEEANLPAPEHLIVFTKFASSLTGPYSKIKLSSDKVDYETELVVVIGKAGHHIHLDDAWSHVAGLATGQDISDRGIQLRGPAAQFSLGKSFPGYSPVGPYIVTVDEFSDPNALAIGAVLESPDWAEPRVLQAGNTADLIFSIPQMISDLSEVVTLLPGDLIFTGTPAGVGGPKGFFLKPGQTLVSTIEGIGTLRNTLS